DIVRARRDVVVVCPVHPNPKVQRQVYQELAAVGRIQLVPPVEYPELLWLLHRAFLVLTDSGRPQEEPPALHKSGPRVRESTHAPEGSAAGGARLVGTARARVVRETLRVLDDEQEHLAMSTRANPFGDGHAAERILQFLAATHTRSPAAECQLSRGA